MSTGRSGARIVLVLPSALALAFRIWVLYRSIRRRQKQAARVLRRELACQGLPPEIVKRIGDIYAQPWSVEIFKGFMRRSRQSHK